MTMQTNAPATGFKSAIQAFMDRRALIILALGFSSGIPIYLIFATLSFWLSEAGVQRSAITMFSWASLAYAFKFIWAPLIDKLPLPYLTRIMGQRRGWLLVSQILVITAICMMSFINPEPDLFSFGSIPNITLMAVSAVFLGFSSATQDIVVDAYRIELSNDPNMQTVLASTYNAGYRTANIITQLGGLLLAASLGTAAGNYIYEAWQTTYLCMAVLMLVGVATTFLIKEPQIERNSNQFDRVDYFHLLAVFLISTVIFGFCFVKIGEWIDLLAIQDPLANFGLLILRFILSIAVALLMIALLIKTQIIRKKVVVETWIRPFSDFFKRYGLKVALALLLLIGFYRISDVVAGVMANLFYLDLNFDKEEIAWFNKFFAVIFVIIGGFLGGVLAQRYNVMKMMLIGAILASGTNLIFVGLVKSGASIDDVTVTLGQKRYVVDPDEVGNWQLKLQSQDFIDGASLNISTNLQGMQQSLNLSVPINRYSQGQEPSLYVQAIGGDDQLYKNQLAKDVIVHGSVANLPEKAQLQTIKVIGLGAPDLDAKVNGSAWSAVIPGAVLAKHQQLAVAATYQLDGKPYVLKQQHAYQTDLKNNQPNYRLSVNTLAAVQVDQHSDVNIKGKVVVPYSKVWLVMGIVFDNLASGFAGAVFIAFLSSLTSISFTAMQYAIFSSLMLLFPKTIAGYSGTIVTNFGYSTFFFSTFLMGIPILFLVLWVNKLLKDRN